MLYRELTAPKITATNTAVDGDDATDRSDAVDGANAGDVEDAVKAGTSIPVETRETRTTEGKKKPRWVYVPPEKQKGLDPTKSLAYYNLMQKKKREKP